MAEKAASIGLPTIGGVQESLMSYGVGILAGVGYNFVTKFTGSGLIGGALAAAAAGAAVKGAVGEMIAVNLGFNVGVQGLGQLGLGNILAGLQAGATQSPSEPQFELL